MPLYFGLGDDGTIESVKVVWPSGKQQELTSDLRFKQLLRIREP